MDSTHGVAEAIQCNAHPGLRQHCILRELGLREGQAADEALLHAAAALAARDVAGWLAILR